MNPIDGKQGKVNYCDGSKPTNACQRRQNGEVRDSQYDVLLQRPSVLKPPRLDARKLDRNPQYVRHVLRLFVQVVGFANNVL